MPKTYDPIDNIQRNNAKLLTSFRQKNRGTIDCAYVLEGGLNGKRFIDANMGTDTSEIHYDPHCGDESRRITKGKRKMNPANILLIIDNSYNRGFVFHETCDFFQKQGYPIGQIYCLYFYGKLGVHGGIGEPFVPILDSAQNFLDKILPKLE